MAQLASASLITRGRSSSSLGLDHANAAALALVHHAHLVLVVRVLEHLAATQPTSDPEHA
eukprot:2814857-Rhodomonas_salina.1